MSTYTNIDWRGLTSGIDRIAENKRNAYSADQHLAGVQYSANKSYEGTVYSADSHAATSKYNTDVTDMRERDLAQKERDLRREISSADREGRKQVAHIQGMYGLGNSAMRVVPTLLPLVATTGGKGSGPKHFDNTPKGATSTATSKVAVPEHRSGFATLTSGTEISKSTSSGVNATTLWNTLKDVTKAVGPSLATGALAALTAMKFVF